MYHLSTTAAVEDQMTTVQRFWRNAIRDQLIISDITGICKSSVLNCLYYLDRADGNLQLAKSMRSQDCIASRARTAAWRINHKVEVPLHLAS